MKLQAPLNHSMWDHLPGLMKLGADEFYIGYINELPHASEILSRRQGTAANFPSIESAHRFIKKINSRNRRLFVCVNEHHYPEEYMQRLLEDMARFLDLGAFGFIISDINMIIKARRAFPDAYLVVSAGAHVGNARAAAFYADLGVSRIILPRHLDPDEMMEIIGSIPGLDFEVFVKNEDCPNMDGLCRYMHGRVGEEEFGHACKRLRTDPGFARRQGPDGYACGACTLFDLKGQPDLTLKIVGRSQPPEVIRMDVAFLAQVLSALPGAQTRAGFAEFCKKTFIDTYGAPCRNRCYYNTPAEIP